MAEYIDREALLQDIEQSVVFSARTGTVSAEMRGARKIVDRIRNAPAADVAPVKRGEWIMKSFHKGVCNQCHRLDDIDPLATHCRYCGSKMDSEG